MQSLILLRLEGPEDRRAASEIAAESLPMHTQGSSQTRNPGLNDGTPMGF